MKTTIQKFLHEPLVHFLIFGGCIYIYYQIISPNQVETAQAFQKQKVVLNKEEIAKLQQDYEQEFHKTPNPTILTLLQQQLYRKKVLLKEAYALQLYKNDKKIDALLLQKIDFILQKQESAKDIDESDLQKYYHKHIQDYSHRKSISFLHIHFANLTQKEQNKIYKLLQYAPKLKGVEKEIKRDKESLQKEYGNYFTQKLFRAKKGEWLLRYQQKKVMSQSIFSIMRQENPTPLKRLRIVFTKILKVNKSVKIITSRCKKLCNAMNFTRSSSAKDIASSPPSASLWSPIRALLHQTC